MLGQVDHGGSRGRHTSLSFWEKRNEAKVTSDGPRCVKCHFKLGTHDCSEHCSDRESEDSWGPCRQLALPRYRTRVETEAPVVVLNPTLACQKAAY